MITFRIVRHALRPTSIVEIFDGANFIATITPGDDRDIRVVSKYLVGGSIHVLFASEVKAPELDGTR